MKGSIVESRSKACQEISVDGQESVKILCVLLRVTCFMELRKYNGMII
jgi:hypothetical protein